MGLVGLVFAAVTGGSPSVEDDRSPACRANFLTCSTRAAATISWTCSISVNGEMRLFSQQLQRRSTGEEFTVDKEPQSTILKSAISPV